MKIIEGFVQWPLLVLAYACLFLMAGLAFVLMSPLILYTHLDEYLTPEE